ncbi:MAG: hypothetical protein C3F06_12605 [Candidatus Methanoperedenaceae archaeon]|nr:MAG: hypothetical protein C3F06_12605 [Candidatus Methanoperedenaceae archaeon]
MDPVITSTVKGREIVIIRLTGARCSECGEQYVDASSSRKALKIADKFRKPAIVFKRKITLSGGRRFNSLDWRKSRLSFYQRSFYNEHNNYLYIIKN